MEYVADTHHLTKRNEVWYFVRRVPTAWRAKLGKTFFKVSLGTSDLAEAKKRRTIEDLKVDAQLAKLDQIEPHGKPLSESQAKPVSAAVLLEYVKAAVFSADDRSRSEFVTDPPNGDDLYEMKIEADVELQVLGDPDHAERRNLVKRWANKILVDEGVTPTNDDAYAQFAEWVRRGMIELARRRMHLYNDSSKHFHDKLFDTAATIMITFGELTKVYWAEKEADFDANLVNDKRADKVKAILKYLDEAVGLELPVASINDDVIQHVRALLAKTPTNRKKFYGDTALVVAIKLGQQDGRKQLSPHTQSSYLEILKGVLTLARRKNYINFNPAENVKPLTKPTVASDQKRLPLTTDQLQAFFGGTFFRSCALSAVNPYVNPDKSWRLWMPLIMLFMGPRPNEVAQLMVQDVQRSQAGTWFLDMVEDTTGDTKKSLKTASSRRRIPIHPELLKMGFLAFVNERRSADPAAQARLFPTLRPNKYDNHAWYAARRFNETFLPAAINLGPRQSLYSLRHNVRDALRRVNAPADALLAIAGWSPSDKAVSDDYGDPGNPDLYVEWVSRIAYPGLDLSFLHVSS